MTTKYYKVAGFVFGIDVPEMVLLGMSNLRPFECREGDGEEIFRLTVTDSLEGLPTKPIFRTDDGPGFPEAALLPPPGRRSRHTGAAGPDPFVWPACSPAGIAAWVLWCTS